jgi:hypothetical protein
MKYFFTYAHYTRCFLSVPKISDKHLVLYLVLCYVLVPIMKNDFTDYL